MSNTGGSLAKVKPRDRQPLPCCHLWALLSLVLWPYLHQAEPLPALVPAVVQQQAGTALLRDDGSDERRVQAQVPGDSLNGDLVFPQANDVRIRRPPQSSNACSWGRGSLTHPPLQKRGLGRVLMLVLQLANGCVG